MKVAVISYQDIDVTDGMDDLFDKYGLENTTVLLPILKRDKQFSQSVVRACLDHGVKVHCFFTSAEGLDHLLKQADDVTVSCQRSLSNVLRAQRSPTMFLAFFGLRSSLVLAPV